MDPSNPLEGILPHGPLEHAGAACPPLTEFKPWHLPRKHYVRRHQWVTAAAALLEVIPHREFLKYMCLPGEDLLDVHVLAELCAAQGRRLRYLGFDSDAKAESISTQRAAAEQAIRQRGHVHQESEVLPDDFASIARPDSLGNQHLRSAGGFDIINLDLCDAFTTREHSPIHAAMREVLVHQFNGRADPWLLFLTTRSEMSRVVEDEVAAYRKSILNNIARSGVLKESLASLCGAKGGGGPESDTAALFAKCAQDAFVSGQVLSLAIGKWLLGMSARPEPWRVDLLSAFVYRAGLAAKRAAEHAKEPPNLFSLAFRFQKIRQDRIDETGLGQSRGTVPQHPRFAPLDEAHLAEKMLGCLIKHIQDIDIAMCQDAALRSSLEDECLVLLENRYYSPAAYREWIRNVPCVGSMG